MTSENNDNPKRDFCVIPDGNCTGCDHCCHDETICVATEDFKKTCSTDCENCNYCDEGEAYCDLDVPTPSEMEAFKKEMQIGRAGGRS